MERLLYIHIVSQYDLLDYLNLFPLSFSLHSLINQIIESNPAGLVNHSPTGLSHRPMTKPMDRYRTTQRKDHFIPISAYYE